MYVTETIEAEQLLMAQFGAEALAAWEKASAEVNSTYLRMITHQGMPAYDTARAFVFRMTDDNGVFTKEAAE